MKIMNQVFISTLFLTICITGCSQNKAEEEGRLSLVKTTNPSPVQLTHKENRDVAVNIKQDVNKFDELYDVAVIKGKKDTLVVYKVKHLKRIQMKQIEKRVKSTLEQNYPDENFIVSSDYKIFMEALELKEKMKEPKYSNEDAEKNLEKIIKLTEEQT